MLFSNLNQTFGCFASLKLWAAPTNQTLTLRSIRSACNPSHSGCFDTLLWPVTRYASLSDRGPAALHSLQPPSRFVCLHRDVVVDAEEEFQRCQANQWFASANSRELREGGNRGGEAKKENRKKQIAVRFTSSRLFAAKKNRTKQPLASPCFIYTNAGG